MEGNKRLLALDVFRGMTIAFMIIVNNPGSWNTVYPPLLHSAWNGCTPTDLVFPFFLFIMGTAMWYSNKKYGHSFSRTLVLKILKRSVIIYIIGLAITAYSFSSIDISKLRLMGVLPRIALAYCIASFIVLGFKARWIKFLVPLILLSYWALLVFCGGDAPFTLEGNVVRRFDIAFLGINHIPVFHGVKFDQTGFLSTWPSIANVLLGYLAGRAVDIPESRLSAIGKLILWGAAGVAIALVWNLVFPINKPLWTSPFVLYTCGLASVSLGILLWITDILGITTWSKPFMVFGLNPLFLYVLSEFMAITLGLVTVKNVAGEPAGLGSWIYSSLFARVSGPYSASLLYAIAFMMFCWLFGVILYKKNIIVKL